MSADDTRPSAELTHAHVQAAEAIQRADEARGVSDERRAARQRAQDRLRADVPAHLAARAHLSVSRDGSITQTFSAAVDLGGCGCGKPAALSSIQKPTRAEFAMNNSQGIEPGVLLSPNQTPAAPGRKSADDLARSLAARVDRTRASFARTTAPLVVYDEQGQVIGIVDPSKLQRPDGKKVVAAFDQNETFIGLVRVGDLTKVAETPQPPKDRPAPPAQIPQSAAMSAARRAGFR